MTDENVKFLFTVLAGLLGIVAFLWNLFGYMWSYIFSHLQIDLTIDKISPDNENVFKITSIVENKGSVAKEIHFAFLLVYPSSLDFVIALKDLCRSLGLENSNHTIVQLLFFINHKKTDISIVATNKISLIAIPYYHQTQFQVGNERVKYPVVFDSADLPNDEAYNVTFTIISLHIFKNYLRYRSTTELFYKP